MSTIQRLKELDAKALRAPWKPLAIYGYVGGFGVDGTTQTNKELIAEMRNALPSLLAVVEAAEGMMFHQKSTGPLLAALTALEKL